MNLLTIVLQQTGGADYSFLIMMVAIFAIMYFFMIRPQNKNVRKSKISVKVWKWVSLS